MVNDGMSEEDKALFRQEMKAVKPLAKSPAITPLTAKPPPAPSVARPKKEVRLPVKPSISLSSYYNEEVQAQTILSYLKHGIPAKRFRDFKSGVIRWEARLDLHGKTTETARESLWAFIMEHYNYGHRCVLIIHGKGSLRGEPPVLKNLVNHWLKQIPEVLAFHSAQPKDGGSGALYVLLKRQREE